jgi:hypothetical protein
MTAILLWPICVFRMISTIRDLSLFFRITVSGHLPSLSEKSGFFTGEVATGFWECNAGVRATFSLKRGSGTGFLLLPLRLRLSQAPTWNRHGPGIATSHGRPTCGQYGGHSCYSHWRPARLRPEWGGNNNYINYIKKLTPEYVKRAF